MLRTGLSVLTFAWASGSGYCGDWAPAPIEVPKLSAAVGRRPVHPAVTEQMIGMIVSQDFRGLGAEAKAVGEWAKGRQHVVMLRHGDGRVLMDAFGDSLRLSSGLGLALERLDRYMGTTVSAESYPISHHELRAAVLSPQGVRSIAVIFEKSIADRLAMPGAVKVLEVGGEATLGKNGLEFHEYPDNSRVLMRKIGERASDPVGLAELFEQYPEAIKVVDDRGNLRAKVATILKLPKDPAKAELRRKQMQDMVECVLENAGSGYDFNPANMLEPVTSVEWNGRHVGQWHTHPPYWLGSSGWIPASPSDPSDNDIGIAIRNGQNLTLAFELDGFDLYDLSQLAGGKPDASKILKISYRSQQWEQHFKAILAASTPRSR
jgi:hypothetical protein